MGDKHPNMRSVGIELPAAHNSHGMFQELLNAILVALPSMKFWTEHRLIDARKRDPVAGTGFKESWMDGGGLVLVGRDRLSSDGC